MDNSRSLLGRHLEDSIDTMVLKIPGSSQLFPVFITDDVKGVLVAKWRMWMFRKILKGLFRDVMLPPLVEIDKKYTRVEIAFDTRKPAKRGRAAPLPKSPLDNSGGATAGRALLAPQPAPPRLNPSATAPHGPGLYWPATINYCSDQGTIEIRFPQALKVSKHKDIGIEIEDP
jgi:hypothetical protein